MKKGRLPDYLLGYPPGKIAIFRALRLGDLLVAVPTLRSLRSAYPHAVITLIGMPWAWEFRKTFQNYLDEFIEFPGFPGLPEQNTDESGFAAFRDSVREQKYDLIVQLHGNGIVTNRIVLSLGGKLAAGWYKSGRPKPEGLFVPYPDGDPEILKGLSLLESLGIYCSAPHLEFPIPEDTQRNTLKKFFPGYPHIPPYVILHPGASDPAKRTDPEIFARFARTVFPPDTGFLVTGTRPETDISHRLIRSLQGNARSLAGLTTLPEIASLVKQAEFVVTNDTAISHIADALDTPSFIFFRNSDVRRWSPLNRSLHVPVRPVLEQDGELMLRTLNRNIRGFGESEDWK